MLEKIKLDLKGPSLKTHMNEDVARNSLAKWRTEQRINIQIYSGSSKAKKRMDKLIEERYDLLLQHLNTIYSSKINYF